MATVGAIVYRRRTEAGLTREQLSERTGLSKGYLADLEQDRYADLTTATIRKLRQALPELTCDELLAADSASERQKRPRGRPRKTASGHRPTERKKTRK